MLGRGVLEDDDDDCEVGWSCVVGLDVRLGDDA